MQHFQPQRRGIRGYETGRWDYRRVWVEGHIGLSPKTLGVLSHAKYRKSLRPVLRSAANPLRYKQKEVRVNTSAQGPSRTPMQQFIFEDVLSKILERDTRYDREAYNFLREALDFTQKALSKARKQEVGHISGEELL